jgi:hypothetical protein
MGAALAYPAKLFFYPFWGVLLGVWGGGGGGGRVWFDVLAFWHQLLVVLVFWHLINVIVIGNVVNVYSRQLHIVDIDSFTRG